MPTTFRDRCHTPLSREEAKKLVLELEVLLDADDAEPRGSAAFVETAVPAELGGLTVVTARQLREEEAEDEGSISDDLSLGVERDAPPDAETARARVVATGYAAHSLVIDPAALARLASCRSTITFEYAGRLHENPRFVSLQRRLFEGVGPSVVESADGSRLELSEVRVAELAAQRGSRSLEARSAKGRPRSPRRQRAALPGEIEALALRERLSEAIADPFASRRLRQVLEATGEIVRAYAALLLDDVPQADARAAKTLGRPLGDVTAARIALAALLASVSGER